MYCRLEGSASFTRFPSSRCRATVYFSVSDENLRFNCTPLAATVRNNTTYTTLSVTIHVHPGAVERGNRPRQATASAISAERQLRVEVGGANRGLGIIKTPRNSLQLAQFGCGICPRLSPCVTNLNTLLPRTPARSRHVISMDELKDMLNRFSSL